MYLLSSMRKSSRVNSLRATLSLKSSRSRTSSRKPEQLFVAVAEVLVDQFLDFVGFEDVVLERGGDVHQRHAGFDAVLEVDVFLQVLRGPEIDQLDGGVHAADTVNAAKALNDADGIPVDVVIDEEIAVLKVLALGNAIGGDEQINLLRPAAWTASCRGFWSAGRSW